MTAKNPELAVSLRRQKIASSETARLGEIAREKAGKLTVIAGTGDAGDKVKVGQKVRIVGVRLPDVSAERDAPAAATSDGMGGEEMAATLEAALVPMYPAGTLRVRYNHPTVWIDYDPMKLKIKVWSQRAFGALESGPPVVTADQSAGPQGIFRTKEGTTKEVVEYVVRFFKKLRDKPLVTAPTMGEAAPGGKARHAVRSTVARGLVDAEGSRWVRLSNSAGQEECAQCRRRLSGERWKMAGDDVSLCDDCGSRFLRPGPAPGGGKLRHGLSGRTWDIEGAARRMSRFEFIAHYVARKTRTAEDREIVNRMSVQPVAGGMWIYLLGKLPACQPTTPEKLYDMIRRTDLNYYVRQAEDYREDVLTATPAGGKRRHAPASRPMSFAAFKRALKLGRLSR